MERRLWLSTSVYSWRVKFVRLGLPPRVIDEEEIKIDFMPIVERKIENDGVAINYIHYYNPVLQPYMQSVGRNGRRLEYIFHYDPGDLSRIYFFDETQSHYVSIPYRDIRRPPLTQWELRAAIKRARERSRSQIDEDAIFRAHEENIQLMEDAVRKTKAQRRRAAAKRDHRSLHKSVTSTRVDVARDDLETASPFEDLEL